MTSNLSIVLAFLNILVKSNKYFQTIVRINLFFIQISLNTKFKTINFLYLHIKLPAIFIHFPLQFDQISINQPKLISSSFILMVKVLCNLNLASVRVSLLSKFYKRIFSFNCSLNWRLLFFFIFLIDNTFVFFIRLIRIFRSSNCSS